MGVVLIRFVPPRFWCAFLFPSFPLLSFASWQRPGRRLRCLCVRFSACLLVFLFNRSKYHGRVKGTPSFFHFRFLSPLWGTPWHRFPRFWLQFGRILEQFWMDFLYFLTRFSNLFSMTLVAVCCFAGWLKAGGESRSEKNFY